MTGNGIGQKAELESSTEIYIQALMRRDSSYDGKFVFANRRLKTYSNPSCPARRPARGNIIIFMTTEEAEKNGYRECKRCLPKSENKFKRKKEKIEEICNYIRQNYNGKISLESLGKTFGMSPYTLQKEFKKTIGISPRKYLEETRIAHLKLKLRDGDSIPSAIHGVGYSSQSWLYENPGLKLGISPSTYRKGGKGVRIRYLTGDTFLGRLIVAFTETGICSVSVADTEEELLDFLKKEFPNAHLEKSEDRENYVQGVNEYLTGRKIDFPLDILGGTEFQRRVWAALTSIPYGSTASYSDVAEAIGNPKAVRAVAGACASNPVPLIIPCHRVVRKSGDPGGYGLGIDRKIKLLEVESKNTSKDLI